MKVTLDAHQFAAELKAVSSVIKTRTTLPVLCYTRLHALDGRLAISATDTDCFYSRYTDAATSDAAPCLLPTRTVLEFLSNGSAGPITVEGNDQEIWIKSDHKKPIRFATLPDKDFPAFPQHDEVEVCEADFAPIQKIIGCSDDSSTDELKRTIIMEPELGGLIAFACSGWMGGTVKFPGVISGLKKLVLNAETWATAARVGPCQLSDSQGCAIFSSARFRLSVKKPTTLGIVQWRTILGSIQPTAFITVTREELAEAIANCHCLRGIERSVRIYIHPTDGGIDLRAGTQVGEHEASIFGRVKGTFSPLSLPSADLLTFLNAQESDVIKIGITSCKAPVTMEAGETTFIFMPFLESTPTP